MTLFRSDMSRVDAAGTAEAAPCAPGRPATRPASRRPARVAAALVAASLLAGCASGAAVSNDPNYVNDPWEQTNRVVHGFNKGLDTALLRPASKVYEYATPGLVKLLVRNGLDMLQMPAIIVNHALQGDVEKTLAGIGRFGVNIVMGGFLLDPATEMGLPKERTDFGLTLAAWGFEEGPYLELPVLGPATVRDGIGRVGHIAFDPLTYVANISFIDDDVSDVLDSYWIYPVQAAVGRSEYGGAIDQVLYESEDSYVTTRSFYLQLRRREVAGGETQAGALPDVFAD